MAGIKVWVLTGDKVTTAINIGKAAGLIDKKTHYETVQDVDDDVFQTQFEEITRRLKEKLDERDNGEPSNKVGLVI